MVAETPFFIAILLSALLQTTAQLHPFFDLHPECGSSCLCPSALKQAPFWSAQSQLLLRSSSFPSFLSIPLRHSSAFCACFSTSCSSFQICNYQSQLLLGTHTFEHLLLAWLLPMRDICMHYIAQYSSPPQEPWSLNNPSPGKKIVISDMFSSPYSWYMAT